MFRQSSRLIAATLPAIILASCHTYEPLPVDLGAHATSFASRLPALPAEGGLTREQGRLVARLFHPDARLARRRAGIAEVQRDHAGRWVDPQLSTGLERILESVPHQWLASASLGFTLPINGRLGKQRDLAARRHDAAVVQAWATEQRVASDADRAWAAWTAAEQRAQLLATLGDDLRRLEVIANGLVTAGSLTRPGARVFQLERVQREAELAMANAERQASELELKRRLGLHPEAPVRLQAQLTIPAWFEAGQARLGQLLDGPVLIALRVGHEEAEAALDLEIRKQWPDLVIAPGWAEEDAQPRATLGLSLPLPIFTGNDPAIATARAERETTAEALRAGYEQVVQRLAIAELRLRAAHEQQLFLAEQLVPLTRQQLVDSALLADAGQFDPLLVLDGLLRAHQVNMQIVATSVAAATAAIDINQLLPDPNLPLMSDEGESR